jgi:predicted enzyme related to lactoylglutathione lyase
MSDTIPCPPGAVAWTDLTVPDATQVRDFYAAVVGWTHSPVDMGGYADFCMNRPGDGQTVAGICHARGVNADLPPQWLIYITVLDLDSSVAKVAAAGGRVLVPPRDLGGARMAVVRDPAGAVAGLYQPPPAA